MSVYLKPQFLAASHFFYLNMSVCLAVTDAFNFLLPGFQVKWPNDILFDKKKVAGILIESTIAAGGVQNCIIGIGVNVNQRVFAEVGNFGATSLHNVMGKPLDKEYLLRVVLKHLEARYLRLREGFDLLKSDYFHALYGFRQKVKAIVDEQVVELEIVDVLADGQLVTDLNDKRRRFLFKEISFLT